MARGASNHSRPWTEEQVQQLRQLAEENTPTRVIALRLGRTPQAVQSKASSLKLSLKPTSQWPYGRSP
jgi:hypothetical protein